jgi:hypothetical protein
MQAFWKEVAHVVEGSDGNTLIVLPEFMNENPVDFYNIVGKHLEIPLITWAGQDKKVIVTC